MEWLRNRKVVVTGGAGFIGSYLVEKLLTLGAEVTVIDNFLHGSKIEHLRGHKSLSIYQGDVRDANLVSQALNEKDVVFHLAACVGVEETQKAPFELLDVEVQGTLNVLNSAVESGIKKFIFSSSSEVYGDSSKPMKEDGPFVPKSTYAVAKLVGEEYCKAFHQRYSLEYTCLRYFNVYGPRQDERFVIPRFVNRMLSDEPILIYGNGNQTRDFTYIDDAVNMTLLAAVEPKAKCQTINIGTGVMTRINDVASLAARALDGKNPTKPLYVDYDAKRPQGIEVFNRVADIARARQLLRYEPKISLQSGMGEYVNWRFGS
ncbi:GDP-mannose 4,6-dehydratase [Dehalococcoidia bacterium]|nr:GDP-mannose 4,6-dehydratase [Dehalococcoidia bacterium]